MPRSKGPPVFEDRVLFFKHFMGLMWRESKYCQEELEKLRFVNIVLDLDDIDDGKSDTCSISMNASVDEFPVSIGQELMLKHPEMGTLRGVLLSLPGFVNHRSKVKITKSSLTAKTGIHKGFVMSFFYNPVTRERVIAALELFRDWGLPRIPVLEAALLGREFPKLDPPDFKTTPLGFTFPDLNESQKYAASLGLTQKVVFLHGPPGTGSVRSVSLTGESIGSLS